MARHDDMMTSRAATACAFAASLAQQMRLAEPPGWRRLPPRAILSLRQRLKRLSDARQQQVVLRAFYTPPIRSRRGAMMQYTPYMTRLSDSIGAVFDADGSKTGTISAHHWPARSNTINNQLPTCDATAIEGRHCIASDEPGCRHARHQVFHVRAFNAIFLPPIEAAIKARRHLNALVLKYHAAP